MYIWSHLTICGNMRGITSCHPPKFSFKRVPFPIFFKLGSSRRSYFLITLFCFVLFDFSLSLSYMTNFYFPFKKRKFLRGSEKVRTWEESFGIKETFPLYIFPLRMQITGAKVVETRGPIHLKDPSVILS